MATVTGLTAARMQEIIDATIVDADVVGDNLILTRDDGATINAGNVRGPQGTPGVGTAEVTRGNYTPTWTGLATGSGGNFVNTAHYTFVGNSGVGGRGLITIYARMRFGTTSPTFPGTLSPPVTLSMPSGFALTSDSMQTTSQADISSKVGDAIFLDDGTSVTYGVAGRVGSAIGLYVLNTTYNPIHPNATVPHSWVAGDGIFVSITGADCIRV